MSKINMPHYEQGLKSYPAAYESRYVDTRVGRTHILISGDPAAPPLVLIHGAGSSALGWNDQIAELSEHYRTYSLDIPGLAGRSAAVQMTTSTVADWVADVFDALGLAKARVHAVSLGGWVSLLFAGAYPARVERMALLVPGGVVPVNWGNVLPRVLPALVTGGRAYHRFFAAMSKRTLPPELLAIMTASTRAAPLRTNITPTVIPDDVLRAITAPILVVYGDHDFFFPPIESESRVRRLIPHAEITKIPDTGHLMQFEEPQAVMRAVLEFLGR
jgi:pimeloyl-ACP methyl ester carboxylesterase